MKSYAQVLLLGSVVLAGLAVLSQLVFTVINSTDRLMPVTSEVTQFLVKKKMTAFAFCSLNLLFEQKMVHVRDYYISQGKVIEDIPDFPNVATSLRTSKLMRNDVQRFLENQDFRALPDASFPEWANFLYQLGDIFRQYNDAPSTLVFWKYTLLFNPAESYPKIYDYFKLYSDVSYK